MIVAALRVTLFHFIDKNMEIFAYYFIINMIMKYRCLALNKSII